MSVEAYVKLHIESEFGNDQNDGHDFELYFGGDDEPYWLNRAEVEDLIERAQAVLLVHEHAGAILSGQDESERTT